MPVMKFPDDENGHVLRTMAERGDDLSKPRDIDYYFVFLDEQSAKDFGEEVRLTTGLPTESSQYRERNMWETRVTRYMIPTHSAITAAEESLDRLARRHRGEKDGWGCFKTVNDRSTPQNAALK